MKYFQSLNRDNRFKILLNKNNLFNNNIFIEKLFYCDKIMSKIIFIKMLLKLLN